MIVTGALARRERDALAQVLDGRDSDELHSVREMLDAPILVNDEDVQDLIEESETA